MTLHTSLFKNVKEVELLGNNVDSKLRLPKYSAYVKWQPCKYTLKNFDKNKKIHKMKPL